MILKNKVIIITGGTRGIGYATALNMLQEGAIVYVCARHEIKIETDNLFYLHLDVTNIKECMDVAEYVYDKHGRIDGLVADAGITRDALIQKMSDEMYTEVMDVNVKGVFNIIKAVQPYMDEKQYGSIVAVSSIVGEFGNIGQINYAASKAAVVGMVKSCAKEFARKGQNIRANAVCPGYILTDMVKSVPEKLLKKFAEQTMLKRLGKPEEVAKVISFLISEQSSYMTGTVIDINGGMRF